MLLYVMVHARVRKRSRYYMHQTWLPKAVLAFKGCKKAGWYNLLMDIFLLLAQSDALVIFDESCYFWVTFFTFLEHFLAELFRELLEDAFQVFVFS